MRTWRDFELTWLTPEDLATKDRILVAIGNTDAKPKGRRRQVEKLYRRFYSERINSYVRSSAQR